MKINTSSWKEFTIHDLGFAVELAKGDLKAQQCPFGNIPLVSSGKTNRGICEYIAETNKSDLYPAGTLTVDMFGKAFYQPEPFYAVGHGRVNMLTKDVPYNKYISLFIVKCIEVVTKKYEFNDMCNSSVLSKIKILLPVTTTMEPDWIYMNSYMMGVEERAQKNIQALLNTKSEMDFIDTVKWEEFAITDIFIPQNTHSILKRDIEPDSGTHPYITASQLNNAVDTYIDYDMNMIEPGNAILIGGKTMAVSYQKDAFFSNDSHNIALYLINDDNKENKYVLLYLAAIIRGSLGHKYQWSDSISGTAILKDHIKLPVSEPGIPNWKYMERYMKQVELKANETLKLLKKTM